MKKGVKYGVALGLCILLAYLGRVYQQRSAHLQEKKPQKTVDEILKERNDQAFRHLNTPLGQAFLSKDWSKFNSIFHPERDFHELAEIIHAGFIQNIFQTYQPADVEALDTLIYSTLKKLDAKNLSKTGFLVSQFTRIPLPPKNLPLYKQMEADALSTHEAPFVRRNALLKLVLQDPEPSPKLVELYLKGLHGQTFDLHQRDWVHSMDMIRGPKVQEQVAKEVIHSYPKIEKEAQPMALLFLAHTPKVDPKALAHLTFLAMKEDHPEFLEAALRAIPILVSKNQLDASQKAYIVKKLTNLPLALRTPFVEAKGKQIQDLLK